MSAPPYQKLFWGSYHKHTSHLRHASEHGAYMLLIAALWNNEGRLAADDSALAAYAKLSDEEWLTIKPKLLMPNMLKIVRGKLTQARVTEDLADYRDTSGKRSRAGKIGGSVSAGKQRENRQANASVLPTQPEPQPEPESKVVVVAVASATDWPNATAKDLAQTLADLNPRIDLVKSSGFWTTAGEITRWRLAGYSWVHDVVPCIEGTARGSPVKNWKYFDPIIAQAHASRTRPQDDHEQLDHRRTENGATVAHFPRTQGGRREPDDIVAIARRRASARERGEIS